MSTEDIEDAKIFLRSVLIASPGVQQLQILKEYKDTTQERLDVRKFGFSTLFDFLKSLEGQVTRMEFSEDLGDNVIYAVVDKSKYTSKHAVKNAEKYGTGIPAKSPEEMSQWLLRSQQPLISRPQKKQNKILTSLQKRNHRPIPDTSKEFALLSRLKPGANGTFSLLVQNIYSSQNLTLSKMDLFNHFSSFRPNDVTFQNNKMGPFVDKRVAAISFLKYINAFKAWHRNKSTICKGQRIGCFPILNSGGDFQIYYTVLVEKLPTSVLLSTLVDIFDIYPGLSQIKTDETNRSTVEIFYTIEKSARDAANGIVKIQGVQGTWHPITVNFVPKSKPSNQPNTPNHNAQKPILSSPNQGAIKPNQSFRDGIGVLPTPKIDPSVNTQFFKALTPIKHTPTQKLEPQVDKDEENAIKFLDMFCAFPLDYLQWLKMFKVCNKQMKSASDLPDEIEFLVTHHCDPSCFWTMRLDDPRASYEKLEMIEKQLEEDVKRVNPPIEHPKVGSRGAALYTLSNKWYRCWVYSSDEEKDEIKVFFCDYGNIETIELINFRCTYSATWSLIPMALPCAMRGYQSKYPANHQKRMEGEQILNQLVEGKRFKATVVKDKSPYQPHIIELQHISADGSSSYLEQTMFNKGYVCRFGDETIDFKSENNTSDNAISEALVSESDDATMPQNYEEDNCFFKYEDDELVIGMIVEVHKPSLLYVYLGALDGFNELDKRLHALPCPANAFVEKNALLVYINHQKRKRRVLVMELAGNKAKVLQVDFGFIEWVNFNELYDITNDLYDYPFQARPAHLAGIICPNETLEKKTTDFLREKIKTPLHFNIIDTSSSGKVTVELFDIDSSNKNRTSINKWLVSNAYAKQLNNQVNGDNRSVTSESSELAGVDVPPPNVTPVAQRKVSSSSVSSWCSNPYFNEVPNTSSQDVTNHKVDRWIEDTFENTPKRPQTPPFPPPDIVESTKLPSYELGSDIRIDGNVLVLGANTTDEERLKLNKNNILEEDEVFQLREKWRKEKEQLLAVKLKLENLSKLNTLELNTYYKQKKLDKLKLKIRIKELECELEKLNLEIENVNEETENLLAQI